MKIQGELSAEKVKIGIVTARFNLEVTEKLENGAVEFLNSKGLRAEDLLIVRVPGAFEVPLAAKYLLESGVDGVVALGAVIRGETSHYDYVCNAVERGCTQLQLEYGKPVAFGVLTTENDEQAIARAGGKHGNKGREAAEVVLEMIDLKRRLRL